MSASHSRKPLELTPSDRRAFPRIPGSAVPGLTALTARSPELYLLDISDGGALIETPARLKPGEREVFLLQGDSSIRIAGKVLRAEVTRLTPWSVHYRSAIQFAAPVALHTLVMNTKASSLGGELSQSPLVTHDSIELQPSPLSNRFPSFIRRLSSVRAFRISSSLITHLGTESVYFEVPSSSHGERRLLQIFFSPHQPLKSEEFVELKRLASVAAGLPDIEMTLP
jgi:hypothetical protein